MNSKTPSQSLVVMNEIVFPNHTNTVNTLMGGHLMYWMDIVSALAAQKHAQHSVVTVSVDNVSFKQPIQVGRLVCLRAQVTRAFRTSMEVFIQVTAENLNAGTCMESNTAFFTFVAIDTKGKPVAVPAIKPQTKDERQRYADAQHRRALRLLLDKQPDSLIQEILDKLQNPKPPQH